MRKLYDKTQYGEIDTPNNNNGENRTLLIISIIIVIIAASVLSFLVYSFIDSIGSVPEECREECNTNEMCIQDCQFKSSIQNFIFTILIFIFILVLLAVYFLLVKEIK